MKRGVVEHRPVPGKLHVFWDCPDKSCKPFFGVVQSIDAEKAFWTCTRDNGTEKRHEFPVYRTVDRSHYPDSCPKCREPAYVGATPAAIDCSAGCYG